MPERLGSSFRWLLGSSWATNFGDGVAMAAAPLLILSLTRDPFLISLGALIGWAPPLVFSLYAGVLSDRLDRRRIVLVANVVRLALVAALIAMIATGSVTVTLALVALALIGVTEVFADNTTSTLTPMLVSRDDLLVANARLQTGFITFNQLAGPPLGALLFTVGAAWPFAGQALLVAAGLVMISRIKLPPHGRRNGTGGAGLWQDLKEGFGWTVRHAAVRTLVLTILIFNFTFGAAWSVLVLYTTERLGLGSIGFGLITTVGAVGGLVGTGLYGAITRRFSLGVIMRVGLILETLTHLGLALTTSPWMASVIFLLFGAHAFIWGATSVTVRQRAVPDELQGRVGSVNTLCVFGGLVVGSLIGGALASHYGVTAPFWFAFAGSAVFVVALWRQLLHITHDEPEAARQA
ncbi:MFS transporter [Nonomuraea sp. NPDC050310]|uniref:MFS transporter n=1 Tax=unclassified Nonomuraea TaxID=2593643 RepID=UPI0033FBADED